MVDLLQLSEEIEPRITLVIVEAAAQKYGTTTNEIHLQKPETIDSIWKDIFHMMMGEIRLSTRKISSESETCRSG